MQPKQGNWWPAKPESHDNSRMRPKKNSSNHKSIFLTDLTENSASADIIVTFFGSSFDAMIDGHSEGIRVNDITDN